MTKTFIVSKNVEVTQEEFIKHLMKEKQFWTDRLPRLLEEQERALAKFLNRQQKRLLEVQMIEHRINRQLKEVMGIK